MRAADALMECLKAEGVEIVFGLPGGANLPTYDALYDAGIRHVRTELIGTDGFQECDTGGITMPIVKHSFMIQDPREIPEAIHQAFYLARTGRPGPVLVDIPQDLSRGDIEYEPASGEVVLPGYQPTTEGNQKQIRLAAKALANARRPVLYAGGGVINANAASELAEL